MTAKKTARQIAADRRRTRRAALAISATLAPAAVQLETRREGRPSLVNGKDARIALRLPSALRAKLETRARTMGVSLSDAAAVLLQRGLDA